MRIEIGTDDDAGIVTIQVDGVIEVEFRYHDEPSGITGRDLAVIDREIRSILG